MELESARNALELGAKATAFREVVVFPNGRGVSIIRHQYSYGGKAGLFEVAVLDSKGEIDYSTPVCGDVLGWQTVDEVLDAMKRVHDLPAEGEGLAVEGTIQGEIAE